MNVFIQNCREEEMFQFAETGAKLIGNRTGSQRMEDRKLFANGPQVIFLHEFSEINIMDVAMDMEPSFKLIIKDNQTLTPTKIENGCRYDYGCAFTLGIEEPDKPRIENSIGSRYYRTKIFMG